MDVSKLSSNWKTLQKSLKPTSSTSTRPFSKNHPREDVSPLLKRKRIDAFNESTGNKRAPPVKKFKAAIWRPDSEKTKTAKRMDSNRTPDTAQPTSTNPSTQASVDAVDAPGTNDPAALKESLGKYIAIDTEMVGTHSPTAFSIPNKNPPHDHSILARVSLVSYTLAPLYDAYVLPPPGVVVSDYRTPFSGVTPTHLRPGTARPFAAVQADVARLLAGRVLVGHSPAGDLRVLGLSHPRARTRNTAAHARFRELLAVESGDAAVLAGRRDGGAGRAGAPRRLRVPGLRWLAGRVLGWEIQADARAGHSSVEDARATMALFRGERAAFENEARRLWGKAAGDSGKTEADGIDLVGVGVGTEGDDGDEDIDEVDSETLGEGDGGAVGVKAATKQGGLAVAIEESSDSSETEPASKPKAKKKRRKGKKKGKHNRR